MPMRMHIKNEEITALVPHSWVVLPRARHLSHVLYKQFVELGDREFCVGNALSLADIATGCALGYLKFRYPDILWDTTHPSLARLYKKLSARASFKATDPASA